KQSEHPLADAITSHLATTGSVEVESFESVTGKGAQASYAGVTYYAGNERLLADKGIPIDSELRRLADEWSKTAHTVVWFADQSRTLAVLAIADRIKDSSIAAIRQLQDMGIETYMLTGDNEATARAIAQQTGIGHYQAEVLPLQKAAF